VVVEIVMYRIREGQLAEFKRLHQQVCSELPTIQGFLAINSEEAIGDELLICDHCTWQSYQSAVESKESFLALAGVGELLDLIEPGSIVRGVFVGSTRG
jgi:hypothetical protein